MVRMELDVRLEYDIDEHGADLVFNIQPAHTPCQAIIDEAMRVSQPIVPQTFTDPLTRNRYLRLRAMPGTLSVSYTGTVEMEHHFASTGALQEVPVSRLPPDVLGYVYPSRYCPSDRMIRFATAEFGGHLQGHSRVQAILDWVRTHVTFASNTSTSSTSALDTLVDRVGVCRDFAHLMIALCRAVNIPARFTTGTDYGSDPALGPPDFHAYVEVYLGDRWYIFDPSGTAVPMGFVRFGTGRDAADVAFATIFGGVRTQAPSIRADAVQDEARGVVLPHLCDDALSTDVGAGLEWRC
ncbi:transglutaminase family protein [Schlegelella sp. S2-27]|uniref:Transglutaminase family protein n=1 Tax=Caldimonas mangrovi TaxID=2944811 RepID=A0ABT0YPK1_9BURK|nr:transglutaminase family protein [Caldimonas mangrovi]MCM5680664.1 transglutaminase family protein [Caldimonas mangrovi]